MSGDTSSWIPSVWGNEVKEDPWLPSMVRLFSLIRIPV